MSKIVYLKQIEHHREHLHRSMAVGEDQIIGHGLSAQRFDELRTYQSCDLTSGPMGEEPSELELEAFKSIVFDAECIDSEQDWFSDRKGGYEISFHRADENH
ncbi:MAG: hypothetical protein VX915_02335 [Pseudomonadota bacterium]|nr:hypothetical protein [Pseudomonadota bacterium]